MAKKVMVIVPRTAPALFAYLKDKFADDSTISVIMVGGSGSGVGAAMRRPWSDGRVTDGRPAATTPSW